MKVSKIKIQNYQQFADIKLNLTYPKDHNLAGKPLQKICLIGPNGIGKTKILELIYSFFERKRGICKYENSNQVAEIELDNKDTFYLYKPNPDCNINELLLGEESIKNFNLKYSRLTSQSKVFFSDQLTNFKTGEIKSVNSVKDAFENFNLKYSQLTSTEAKQPSEIVLQNIKNKFYEYAEKVVNYRDQKVENNFLKLQKIFNNIFSETGVKLEKVENLQLVFSKQGKEMIYDRLSSGEDQIFYRLVFLASLELQDSIILIDEPENSLFPDKQKAIVDWYLNLTNSKFSNQYFFATHSPLVASQFEPWEIFALDIGSDKNTILLKEKQEKLGSIGYSSDEMLQKWYGVDPRRKDYYEAMERFFYLETKTTKSQEEIKELQDLKNGNHPKYGQILSKSVYFSN